MKPHLILVSLGYVRPSDPRTTLGHASILVAVRRDGGINVTSLEYAVNDAEFDAKRVLDDIVSNVRGSDSTIAFGAYVWNDEVVRWLLRELRRRGFPGLIVLGGPQISYTSEGREELYPEASYFISGYGEEALVALMHGETLIQGVTRRGDSVSPLPAAFNFADAASPHLDGTLTSCHFVRWETQRGCPYACSFCQHQEPGQKLKLRQFPRERLEEEMCLFVQQGVKKLVVLDPLFNVKAEHANWILRRLIDLGYRGSLSLQCRFEQLTPEFIELCRSLDVTLEFGLQTIHEAEMVAVERHNDLKKVDRWIRELLFAGIRFEVSLIYGLPEQTLASFRQSVEWCRSRHVPVIRAFPLMLLRGTAAHTNRERWCLIESNDPIPVVVSSNTFTSGDRDEMRLLAETLDKPKPMPLVSSTENAA